MAQKFPEAEARMFRNKYVCRSCKTKVKAPVLSILAGKIVCPGCGSKVAFRPKRMKKN
jgi:DNA-directed RNA polymerase subunit RPC12/RpoP